MNDETLLKPKKNKRKGLWIALAIFGVVIIALVGGVFYTAYDDLKQEDLLKKEVVTLSNKNPNTDDFSINIVTKGDYAYVEKAVKEFYLELSNNIKKFSTILNDSEVVEVLSVNNITSDGPDFVKSLALIDSTTSSVKESLNNIIDLCNEEAILGFIDKNKVDEYYIDLYKELMLTDSDKKDLDSTKTKLTNFSLDIEDVLNKAKELLLLLKNNNGSWSVSDGQLYFITNELVNTYNNLYNELMNKADEIEKYIKSGNNDNDSNNKENVA